MNTIAEKRKEQENMPDIERDGWTAEEVVEEGSYQEADDTVREILRGDETKGNPDDRDTAGSPHSDDTPHGREETKNE